MSLFPIADYWWLYGVFLLFVLLMLALDLSVFNRKSHVISFKEAAIWSAVWVTLALIFNLLFFWYCSWKFGAQIAEKSALEFLAGYVLEYSLSIDNIFVFVLVFNYFQIPPKYKHRVLFYGILGALIFRAIFIALGSALLQFHWVVYIFGAFLILTGLKMSLPGEQEIHPERNFMIRLFRRFLPATHEIADGSFFSLKDGVRHATPLFIALIFLEVSDIIFAVDSVPAIFGITNEPFIVFTSNIFAILGLRSMYFMLAGVIRRFHLLRYGLAFVLTFVGLKMVWLNDLYEGGFPITWSLGIIATAIALAIIASITFRVEGKESAGDSG
ncbi:MAG TPA: TerC family protein [Pyrinomonadaceae bacterium]|nr:TerC family protein [Pyrinomonadaceae bacterium]